jgi:S-adenosylmethionine:tRNA ribosyltransferase-isomerase
VIGLAPARFLAGRHRRAEAAAPVAPAEVAGEVARHAVRLLVVDPRARRVAVAAFAELPSFLAAGDLVVVNDAGTLPAALAARTAGGDAVEVRLLGAPVQGRVAAVVLGAGDHRQRTEDRPPPPPIAVGDRLALVPWTDRAGEGRAAAVTWVSPLSPRWIELDLGADRDAAWRTIYDLGRPVQYAHRPVVLPLWAVQTVYAGPPVSAEMPSAGRPMTWDLLLGLRRRGVAVASLTHEAGLSSTGDPAIDAALPLPERYHLPAATAAAIDAARGRGGRVIAIGTTVMRALESAAIASPRGVDRAALRTGAGTAALVITSGHRPLVVDGLVSGIHAPADSHHRVLAALADAETLARAGAAAAQAGLHGHELGDATLVLPDALADRAPGDGGGALRSRP